MTTEVIWKTIPSYPNYEASNTGLVRHYKNKKPLTPSCGAVGYYYVGCRKSDRTKTVYVHFAVAEAFLGPRPEGMQIDHIDNDRFNNSAKNLCYVTQIANLRKKAIAGTDRVKGTKITDDQLRELRNSTMTYQMAMDKYSICYVTVWKLKHYKVRKDIT